MGRPAFVRSFAAVVLLAAVMTMARGVVATGVVNSDSIDQPTAIALDDVLAQIEAEDGVLRFDVAEDATRFVWSGDPELVDGMPTGSTPYVTQGYIYPEGTLSESNGVNADGSPEFPDKVLGQWSCWGWRLGASNHAASAPWLTTHLFNFGDAWGEATLVSEGYSIDDIGVALARVVAGGTGPYAGATGVQRETNLGFNTSNGMNFRYELRLSGGE
jgi:hypothetical protein